MGPSSGNQESNVGTQFWLPEGMPSQLGLYELVRLLGRGGMGMVFEANQQLLGQRAAVKVLRPQFAQEPGFAARFRREMAALGKIKEHPNLVRAHYAGEESGVLYLAMEFVAGKSFADLLAGGPLPFAEACEAIRQAALGVEAIRQADLVHRDLKPSNLMLTPDGTVKILDLGLARLRELETAPEELTPTNAQLGTFDYQAPEQSDDPRRVDIRADIYSLGCTLYRLLTSRLPFGEHLSAAKKIYAHAHLAFPTLGPAFPAELGAILAGMTTKEPAQRYATPLEVAAALEPFARGADLAALLTAEPGARRPLNEASTRSDRRIATSHGSDIPDAKRSRRRRFLGAGLAMTILVSLAAVIYWQTGSDRSPDDAQTSNEANTDKGKSADDGKATEPVAILTTPRGQPEPSPVPVPAGDGVLPAGTPPHRLDDLAPAIEHDLLALPPVEAYWDRKVATGYRQYRSDPRQFHLNPSGNALFHLGTLSQPSFAFRVQISQNRWASGAGVYFGYRETGPKSSPWVVFQYLLFNEKEGSGSRRVYRVARGVGKLVDIKGRKSFTWDEIESEDIPTPDSDQILSFNTVDQVLQEVAVNGKRLARLTSPEANKLIQPADYQGCLGLLSQRNSSIYREAYITFQPGR